MSDDLTLSEEYARAHREPLSVRDIIVGVALGMVLGWLLIWLGAQALPEAIYWPVKFVVES